MSAPDDYRRLCRLREKIRRFQRLVAMLERKLAGKKCRWGNCSYRRNRKG